MADKKITVEVEVTESNKTGEAAKAIEKSAQTIEKAANKAGDAMEGLGKASSGVGGIGGGGPGVSTGGGTSPFVAEQMRLLRLDVEKIRNGPVAGSLVTGGTQVVASGVVAGMNKSKGIFSSAWSVARYGGGGQYGPPPPGGSFAGMNVPPGGMKAAYDDLTKSIKELRWGLLAASAATAGFVAAGAPWTWTTFTGSITLLGDQIAQLLIPAFNSASQQLQNAATWVENLDSHTKEIIITTATWGGGILVTSAILTGIGSILIPVIRGVISLGAAMIVAGRAILAYNSVSGIASLFTSTMNMSLLSTIPAATGFSAAIRGATVASLGFAMSPLGLALIGIAATVGVLTNGFGLMGSAIDSVGARADLTRERMERLQRLQQPGAQLTRTDFESLGAPIVRQIENTPMDQRRTLFEEMLRTRQAELAQTQQRDTTRQSAIIEDVLGRNPHAEGLIEPQNMDRRRREMIVNALAASGFSRTSAQAQVNALPAGALRGGFTTNLSPAERRQLAREVGGINLETGQRDIVSIMERLLEQGVPGVFGGTLKTSIPVQPQMFQSGADAYYAVLQEVLSRGPIEQEHLRNIMESTRIMAEDVSRRNGVQVANPPPQPPGVQPP